MIVRNVTDMANLYNLSSATHFQDTFSEAVRRLNEAGCVQWVKHTIQPVYVKVMINRGT